MEEVIAEPIFFAPAGSQGQDCALLYKKTSSSALQWDPSTLEEGREFSSSSSSTALICALPLEEHN